MENSDDDAERSEAGGAKGRRGETTQVGITVVVESCPAKDINKMKNIRAIVLAAGQGKRMKSSIPKVLHPISGLPMVLLVIDVLKKSGINKIIVVIGHGGDKVREVLPDYVDIVDQGKPLGTGHAVLCARKLLGKASGDLLIACADMPLVKKETIKRLVDTRRENNVSCAIMTGIIEDPKGYGRIIRGEDRNVQKIEEDIDTREEIRGIKEVNSGMYCFKAGDLFGVLPEISKNNRQKEFYLTDSVSLLIKRGCKALAFCVSDPIEILGINSRKDLAFANRIMNKRILEIHMDNGVSIISPETTHIDLRVKIGRDTVINPFTVIEGDVRIGAYCEIGPFTHLRDKTVLKNGAEIGNFVEVKKSSVGKYSKAKHLTYLGDSIIGEHVNVGAGTITANYDGKNKYKTIIKDKAFIGTHTTLIAPVTIGKGAVTGAGSVVLRNRNVPKNTVVAGVPAKVLRRIK